MRSRWVDIYLLFAVFWSLGTQRVAAQGKSVVALHDAVQNGVRDRGVADPGVPMLNRQLAGDDRRFTASPVINDLQEVRAGHAVDGAHTPVVEYKDVGLGQLEQPFAEGPATVPDTQFFLQAGYTLVDRAVATPAGVLRQCAGQPRLASAGRAGDQHTVTGADPLAQSNAHHLAAVDASTGTCVDILNRSLAVLEVRVLGVPGVTERLWKALHNRSYGKHIVM